MTKTSQNKTWRQYEAGRNYKRQIGLYSRIAENERFYRGDQWRGGEGLPKPVFNVISRIVDYLVSSAAVGDVIFGTLATLIGAVGTRLLRKKSPYLAVLPPIIANMLIVPFVLRYCYGMEDAIWFMMLTVGAGEIVAAGILALLLRRLLEQNRKQLFPEGTD